MQIVVCTGSRCMLVGGETIFNMVEDLVHEILDKMPELSPEDLQVNAVPCQRVCSCEQCYDDDCKEPVVVIDGEILCNTSSQEVMSRILERFPVSLD